MSQGWSDISISIKSDMLAKLLRDHGVTPKGAGNVKNGIIYDVDFEWEYTSRYEYMAYNITDVGELIFYYISCVLAVENGKKLEKLEEAYLQNTDAIKNSVECAYYSATVHWDIVAYGEESYEFQLEPPTRAIRKGTTVLRDPKTVAQSYDNSYSLLGEFDDHDGLVQLLEIRGWKYEKDMDAEWVSFEIDQHQEYGSIKLRRSRFIIIGDKTFAQINQGMHNRLVSDLQKLQKLSGCVLISQQGFLKLGQFLEPVVDFSAFSDIQGKKFLLDGIEERKLSNQIRHVIKQQGGEVKTGFSSKIDFVVYAERTQGVDSKENVKKAMLQYEKAGSVVLLRPDDFFKLMTFVAPAETVPESEDAGSLTGKTFVLANYEEHKKALATMKKFITDNGGVIRTSVSGKTDFVVCKHFDMLKWSEYQVVGGKRVEIVHEYESKKIQEAKKLQETGAKVELILEEAFMERFG